MWFCNQHAFSEIDVNCREAIRWNCQKLQVFSTQKFHNRNCRQMKGLPNTKNKNKIIKKARGGKVEVVLRSAMTEVILYDDTWQVHVILTNLAPLHICARYVLRIHEYVPLISQPARNFGLSYVMEQFIWTSMHTANGTLITFKVLHLLIKILSFTGSEWGLHTHSVLVPQTSKDGLSSSESSVS